MQPLRQRPSVFNHACCVLSTVSPCFIEGPSQCRYSVPVSIVYIDVHPFRIEWKVQISNIHKCWISSLIAQPWIASIRGTDRENGTPRLSESRNHNHVSHMSREWTERSPVGTEDLASYLLPKQFKLVHKPGPLVEAIISPIPMTHIA